MSVFYPYEKEEPLLLSKRVANKKKISNKTWRQMQLQKMYLQQMKIKDGQMHSSRFGCFNNGKKGERKKKTFTYKLQLLFILNTIIDTCS